MKNLIIILFAVEMLSSCSESYTEQCESFDWDDLMSSKWVSGDSIECWFACDNDGGKWAEIYFIKKDFGRKFFLDGYWGWNFFTGEGFLIKFINRNQIAFVAEGNNYKLWRKR
jgi:hypothetical protein